MTCYSLSFLAVSWDYDRPWAKVLSLPDNPTDCSGPRRFFGDRRFHEVVWKEGERRAFAIFTPEQALAFVRSIPGQKGLTPEMLEEDYQNLRSIESTLADCSHVIVQVAEYSDGSS
jgi:hypothetical protein